MERILEIKTKEKTLRVPFSSFEDLDNFTSLAKEPNDFARIFFNDKGIQVTSVKIIYSYKSPRDGKEKVEELDVKYSLDNFDLEDLLLKYETYFLNNPREILKDIYGLNKIIYGARAKNNNDGYVKNNEVHYAVNEKLNPKNRKAYKAKRDAYFFLKKKGILVRTRKTKSLFEEYESVKISKNISLDDYILKEIEHLALSTCSEVKILGYLREKVYAGQISMFISDNSTSLSENYLRELSPFTRKRTTKGRR